MDGQNFWMDGWIYINGGDSWMDIWANGCVLKDKWDRQINRWICVHGWVYLDRWMDQDGQMDGFDESVW